jgi:hypothetical protein
VLGETSRAWKDWVNKYTRTLSPGASACVSLWLTCGRPKAQQSPIVAPTLSPIHRLTAWIQPRTWITSSRTSRWQRKQRNRQNEGEERKRETKWNAFDWVIQFVCMTLRQKQDSHFTMMSHYNANMNNRKTAEKYILLRQSNSVPLKK